MARNEDDSSTSLICTFAAKMHCTTYRMEHQSCYRSIVFRADLILFCFTNKYHLDHFNFGFESGFDSAFDSGFDSGFDSPFESIPIWFRIWLQIKWWVRCRIRIWFDSRFNSKSYLGYVPGFGNAGGTVSNQVRKSNNWTITYAHQIKQPIPKLFHHLFSSLE